MAFTAGQYLLHTFFQQADATNLLLIEEFSNILALEIVLVAQVHAPDSLHPSRRDQALTSQLRQQAGPDTAEPKDDRKREAVGRERKHEPVYKELTAVFDKNRK